MTYSTQLIFLFLLTFNLSQGNQKSQVYLKIFPKKDRLFFPAIILLKKEKRLQSKLHLASQNIFFHVIL